MYWRSLPFAIAAIFWLTFFTPSLEASEVQLSWAAPTVNVDGSPLTDLAGYNLYYGQASKNYQSAVNIGNQNPYTLSGLESGKTYYFGVTAYDSSNNESAFSNEATITVPPPSDGSTRISLSPSGDTNINLDALNYSSNNLLHTYTWPDMKIANAIIMKFDLSSIPQGASIQEAKLNLSLVESDGTADNTYTITAHKLNKNPNISLATGYTYNGTNTWTANTCCFDNIPLAQADISPAYATKPIDKIVGYKSWVITSMVQEWMTNPNTNFGILLNSDPGKLRDRYRFFASKEHSNINIRPYLSISYATVQDSDGDGLSDADEMNIYGTDPNLADTDGDGINDSDELVFWGANWHNDPDGDGMINLLDRDSDNDGYADGLERLYGSNPGNAGSKPQLIEVGEVSIDHNWKRVTLQLPFLDPVVVAKPPSYNDTAPGLVRLRNVNKTGFDIRLQEWDYLNGTHALETVGYVVMERGRYTLSNGVLVEAGRFNTNRTSSFGSFMFSKPFNVAPVLLTAVSSVNEAQAVTTRMASVNTTGFKFRMQEQELNQQAHATETIAYIAWEPSSGAVNGLTFQVGRTGNTVEERFQMIQFTEAFTKSPVFIADMQTTSGSDTASLRWDNKDLTGVDVKVEEEQSRDSETDHSTEVVGYLVIQ